jgi:hypothetical protein
MKYGPLFILFSLSFFPPTRPQKETKPNVMHNEPSIKDLFNSVLNYG